MRHARDRIRDLTGRERTGQPVEDVVQDINRFLRGWANYFRYGNSSPSFDAIMVHATRRLSLLVAKRHQRASGYGWWAVAYQSPDRMGLLNIAGTVVSPRPHRAWRG